MNTKKWQVVLVIAVLWMSAWACDFSMSTANIQEALMARDPQGSDPTTVFAPSDTFYCIVDLANAPDDTTVRAVWTAVQVEGTEANTLIDEASLQSGSGMLQFELANTDLWPAGQYKVDLYLNEELNQTLEFQVQ